MARKQQEKSKQTKKELMDSAEELFGLKGFIATTVAEITTHAGYSKGSFYRHWVSKDKLFLEIVENKLAAYRSSRDNRLDEAQSLEEVMHIIWDFLEIIVRDYNWAKVFLEFTVYASRIPELRDDLGLSQYRLSETVFANLVGKFIETDYPPEKLGAFNTVLFEGFMVQNALETGIVNLKDVREAAVTLALANGLKKN
ncbi:transcriptional regulator, TetR family [Maridesulfovibrio ferrireducens]|uniref:Transcriptional regulator, TetR family n=1 Tax=Maridesulfovibrio ferrireducens TaxID=246191 RepID=A0A1G9GU03_9BACT|nr:TetR/AcrR family transcriptional regulator [Maridesulfovibrio ferrireducens]SDL04072.1 transcriptional regulator, TetR family [Maridesulfovibrio ferrireducens]